MRFIIKRLFEIVILSIAITILATIAPINVKATSDSSICPTYNLSPTVIADENTYYDPDVNSGTIRECVHNFTKINNKQNVEPSITVLTHGLGGDPSHWSNDGITQTLSYDSESIIEKIRGLDVGNTEVFVIENNIDKSPTNAFQLKLLQIPYIDIENIAPTDLSTYTLNKKVVILFQSSDNMQHNITDYHELDYIIDFFSYKYYLDYHYIPKVNLIGHSRGGLTNIQYVNEHPFNVDSVFSIDTPYFGSEFGQMTELMNLIKDLSDSINSCGGQDILDTGNDLTIGCDLPLTAEQSGSGTLQQKYLSEFEEAKEKNDQIKAYAIGSAVTMEFLIIFLGEELTNFLVRNDLLTADNQEAFNDFLDEKAKILAEVYTVSNVLLTDIGRFNELFKRVLQLTCPLNITPEMTNFCETRDDTPYLNILDNFIFTIGNFGLPEVDDLINNSSDNLLQTILLDDIFIHTNSQLGRTLTQSYDFETFLKVYNSQDISAIKSKTMLIGQRAVPHNLSARDPDIISYIMGKIKRTEVTTTINYTDYSATLVSTQTEYDNIVIPAFDPRTGNPIKSILENSFSSESSVKSIYIPSTVTTIDANAFIHLPNLTSIEVDPDNPAYSSKDGILMSRSTNTVFAYPRGRNPLLETTLLGIDLSNPDDNAFIQPGNVDSIYIPAHITTLDDYDFNQYPNLKEIKVTPGNPTYKVVNGMLINKQTNTVIAYPRAKTPTSSTLVIPSDVTDIGEQAFQGNSHLSIVDISNVERIHEHAFEGSSVTSIIGNNQLTSVGKDAFKTTPLYDQSTIVVIESVLIKYSAAPVNGVVNLTNYSTGKPEDQQIKIINEYAFSSNSLVNELRLPSSTLIIGDFAFENLLNLTKIYIPSLVDIQLSPYSLAHLNPSLTIYVASDTALNSEKLAADVFRNITIVESVSSLGTTNIYTYALLPQGSSFYIAPYQRNGYEFLYWEYPLNTIPTQLTNQYGNSLVPWASYSQYVMVKAAYRTVVYQLELIVDGASLATIDYTIESSTDLPTAYLSQFHQTGWNCNGTIITRLEPGLYGNHVCSAVFEPNTILTISNQTSPGSRSVTGTYTTVNLPNGISTSQLLTLTISSTTQYVEIKGVAFTTYNNTKLIINSRTTPLTIAFNNVILLAPAGSETISHFSSTDLYLNSYGYVYLKGGDGSLSSISNGNDGRTVLSSNGNAYLYSYRGYLTLWGGNGSTGITGLNGINGTDGANGFLVTNGGNGTDGTDGQSGGQGGDGGIAIKASSITLIAFNSTISLYGGNGGKGGTGGNGGSGGDGGDGITTWFYTTSGGNGGDGGDAGLAGLGGFGGNPIFSSSSLSIESSAGGTIFLKEGTNGQIGLLGYKGLGGDGGFTGSEKTGLDGLDGTGR